jgi:PAS domain S-box-containing protein
MSRLSGILANKVLSRAIIALLYYATAKFGLSLATDPEQITAVWPPTGLALVLLIRLGTDAWPGIFLGAFLANVTANEPIPVALGIAVGNTLEAFVGATLLKRFKFTGAFENFSEVIELTFLAAGLSTLLSASIGVLSLSLGGVVPWHKFLNAWALWWLGDVMGAIVIAPLLMVWTAPAPGSPRIRWVEAAIFFASLLTFCYFMFIDPYGITARVRFFLFPFFVWAPIRLGQRLTTFAVVLVAAAALWSATHGTSAFMGDTTNQRLLLLQGFMSVLTLSALALGAISAERRIAQLALIKAGSDLRAAHDQLEARVAQRTEELHREVGERERAQIQLAENRRELQDYIDNMSTMNAKIGVDGRILLAGRAAQMASGLSPEQIVGFEFLSGPWFSFDPEVHARVREAFAKAVAGTAVNYEEKVKVFGTQILDISFSLIPISGTDGRVKYILAEGRDITALKAAETRLRESETKLRVMLENVSDYAIFVLDAAGHVTSWNRGAEHLKGYTADEIIGRHYTLFYTPEEIEAKVPQRALQAAAETGRFEHEGWRLRKNGSRFWANVVITAMRDEKGVVYGFAKVTRDLTERKRAEDALRNYNQELERRVSERTAELETLNQALRDGEERLRVALDAGNCGAWDWDVAANRITWSDRVYEFHGLAPDQFGGRIEDFNKLVHPDDFERVRIAIEKAHVDRAPFAIEFRIVRPTGEIRWTATRARVIYDAEGKAVRMLGVSFDMTERKNAELELQRAKEAADAANRAKDEFLAVVSHELRTPLTPVLGWTRMLRTRNLASADMSHALEVIERNVRAQSQLVEDLLDISRIITGKLRLHTRRLSVASVIRAAVETVEPAAQSKSITLVCDLEDSAPPVHGDADRIQQVIWNLLTNALKFTPREGRIVITQRQVDGHIEVTVQDSGEGISPDFLPHLFNRFTQADSTTTRAHGGLGLGLAIVRHIMELHGGSVKAESKGRGEGAKFTISMPVFDASRDAESKAFYRTTRRSPENGSLRDLRILIVDDEQDSRELMALALKGLGANVTSAGNVPDALAEIALLTPDVLISDIGMPGEDGFSLIRKIRAQERIGAERLPAIALTAYARAEDRTRILSAGFQVHVPKPVDPDELAALVVRVAHKNMN